MRSLEEWTKYLEQQEQSVERSREPEEAAPSMNPLPAMETAPSVRADPPKSVEQARPTPPNAQPPARTAPSGRTMSAADHSDAASVQEAVRMRKRLPKKPSSLPDGGQKEAAQGSYKGFKESREELLQRLLDPILSLEDAARVLDVCPTTVRRYTNKGLLKHIRTAGNQRRFYLSDVLALLKARTPGAE
jgi:excisionase family DNA binding protein